MKRHVYWLAVTLLVLAACTEEPVDPVHRTDPALADTPSFGKTDGNLDMKDRYIVVFKDNVRNSDRLTDELMKGNRDKIHFRYHYAIQGFAATIPAQAIEGIKRNPNVDYVEADGLVYAIGTQNNPPSWGLDRIDQANLPLNNQYNYGSNGSDVTAYIIDTCIRFDHQEYNGRAFSGYDFVDGDPDASDCHGHGTHVAGTVGGTNVGVAKGVTLIAVRVLDCQGSGSYSGVIAGVDWVTQNHSSPAVANMSLGGGYSSAMNQAVNNSVNSGVTYAVAAGNNNQNACNYSPASAANAICVGATTSSDARSSFSNYGSCVDIFAPGSGIYSSTITGSNTYASWSGTSMASPHVAGVAALYLSANPNATTSQVRSAIIGAATSGVLTGIGSGSPNLLLNNQFGGPVLNPPAAPTGLNASAVSTSQIDLSWTDNAGNEDGFYVERSSNGSSGWAQIAALGANVTAYQNTGLSQNATFYYRVRAYNADGNSAYSNTANATTFGPPADPGNFNATAVSTSQINLSWSDVAGETSYELDYSTASSSGPWTALGPLPANGTAYNHIGLPASTMHYYRLRAVNGYGNSAYVSTSAATLAPAPTVHVGATNYYVTTQGKNWFGNVTVTVHDGSDNAVSGVTVYASWSGDVTGSGSAVTDGSGQATIATDRLRKDDHSVTITVTGLSGNYNPGANHATMSQSLSN